MKKPDEIKKGLEYCSLTNVAEIAKYAKRGIPYAYVEELAADALAYIRQLERERDAMSEELHGDCWHCKHEESSKCEDCKYSYDATSTNDHWEWRGLPEV